MSSETVPTFGTPSVPRQGHRLLARALEQVLVNKGLLTHEAVDRSIEAALDAEARPGARLIARCWVDPEFETRALKDVRAAANEIGIDTGRNHITLLKNTADLHNVIVCTLCSCTASALLGEKPAWYKSVEYRARIVREPRAVLAEFGTSIPLDAEVRVQDSTAERGYIVLPMRPAGTEGWTEAELAACVDDSAMLGVTPARIPG
jgi:nitrile hydratase